MSLLFAAAAAVIVAPAQAAAIDQWQSHIDEAAKRFGIPASWIRAVIEAESEGDPRAVSPKGAMGLMQITPPVARAWGTRAGRGRGAGGTGRRRRGGRERDAMTAERFPIEAGHIMVFARAIGDDLARAHPSDNAGFTLGAVPLRDIRVGDRIWGTRRDGRYRRFLATTVRAHWSVSGPAQRIDLSDGEALAGLRQSREDFAAGDTFSADEVSASCSLHSRRSR